MKPRPVYVVWKDHAEADTGPWADMSDLARHQLATCHTFGYLLEERKDSVLIASTLIPKLGLSGRPDVIAKALIVSMVDVKVPKR